MMKKLEYRKIQRVGKGSFILTLPREWVKEVGLDKGDHIGVMVRRSISSSYSEGDP